MRRPDTTAAFIGFILIIMAFGYSAGMWGLWQAVELAIMIGLVFLYIEFEIYLFTKSSLLLNVIAIFLFPLVALALFMPISLRRRVRDDRNI